MGHTEARLASHLHTAPLPGTGDMEKTWLRWTFICFYVFLWFETYKEILYSGPHVFSRKLVQYLNNPSFFLNPKCVPGFLPWKPDRCMVQMLFDDRFCRWYLSEGNRVTVHYFLICDYMLSG